MSDEFRQKRISTLKSFLEKDQRDTFTRYALALEYLNCNDLEKGISELETILEYDPEYIATYYQLAKSYVNVGEKGKARAVYEKGIELTELKGDTHTNQELRDALTLIS